jgi:CheY-like chemotaxis protein
MAAPKRTVLILDNDEVTRELYRRELERRFDVVAVNNEQEAWDAITAGAVDGVVLEPAALADEEWAFVARLRTSEVHRRVPIVVCSTMDARRRGAELGAVAYLIKPVTPQLLSRTLQSAMQNASPIVGN